MARTSPTGLSKRIWMLLLQQGGWWSTREIAESLDESSDRVSRWACEMADAGRLRWRGDPRKRQFSVTSDCIIPRSVTVADVLAVRA